MNSIISWCNDNSGFMSAVLSLIGLVVSGTAIAVSVQTARMPYKKRLKLSYSWYARNLSSHDEKESEQYEICGIVVNCINTGFRTINIKYLGIIVKENKSKQKLYKIVGGETGKGIIKPTQIKTEYYMKDDLSFDFPRLKPKTKVYLYAEDSEGKKYRRYIGKASLIAETLS